MKITVTKVKRELIKKHGWSNLDCDNLIKDIISIIDKELIKHKNITIKK